MNDKNKLACLANALVEIGRNVHSHSTQLYKDMADEALSVLAPEDYQGDPMQALRIAEEIRAMVAARNLDAKAAKLHVDLAQADGDPQAERAIIFNALNEASHAGLHDSTQCHLCFEENKKQ